MLRWPDPKVGGAGAAMGTIHVTVRDPTFPGGAVDLGLVETVGIGLLDDLWPRRTCYMILSLQPARGNKVNLSPYMKDLKSAATRS